MDMKKPTIQEWVEWAQNAKFSEPILIWVKDNPQVFPDTTQEHNPYIYQQPTKPTTKE
jgi:hypothetical protein